MAKMEHGLHIHFATVLQLEYLSHDTHTQRNMQTTNNIHNTQHTHTPLFYQHYSSHRGSAASASKTRSVLVFTSVCQVDIYIVVFVMFEWLQAPSRSGPWQTIKVMLSDIEDHTDIQDHGAEAVVGNPLEQPTFPNLKAHELVVDMQTCLEEQDMVQMKATVEGQADSVGSSEAQACSDDSISLENWGDLEAEQDEGLWDELFAEIENNSAPTDVPNPGL